MKHRFLNAKNIFFIKSYGARQMQNVYLKLGWQDTGSFLERFEKMLKN